MGEACGPLGELLSLTGMMVEKGWESFSPISEVTKKTNDFLITNEMEDIRLRWNYLLLNNINIDFPFNSVPYRHYKRKYLNDGIVIVLKFIYPLCFFFCTQCCPLEYDL
jgi:hypothetical protein